MYAADTSQFLDSVDQMETYANLPLALVVQPDPKLYTLLTDLTQDTPWGDRQIAARKLGRMRNPDALPWLLEALPVDPFWMVRCAIIQALEMIGDPGAIPVLREVAQGDGFQVVRSYAAKAIERLSQAA